MPQCSGKTQAGKRCKRRLKSGRHCAQHATKSSKTKVEKLALGVSLAGGSVALLEKMSHIVGYVTTHWTEITTVIKSLVVGCYSQRDPHLTKDVIRKPRPKRPYRPRNLEKHVHFLLEIGDVPEEELKAVSRKFDRWFNGLPPKVQQSVVKHYGTQQIKALRGY